MLLLLLGCVRLVGCIRGACGPPACRWLPAPVVIVVGEGGERRVSEKGEAEEREGKTEMSTGRMRCGRAKRS